MNKPIINESQLTEEYKSQSPAIKSAEEEIEGLHQWVEDLVRENTAFKKDAERLLSMKYDDEKLLRERIDSLKKERDKFEGGDELKSKKIEKLEADGERLRSIIYSQFTFYHEETAEEKKILWEEFKTKNNL